MNQRQREVAQSQINAEKDLIRSLEKTYRLAMRDIEERIARLDEREGMEPDNIRTIVHQRKYQQAIRKEIQAILDDIKAKQYKTVNEYINGCYQLGYVGSMYDLHGQGIPVIMPINQDEVVRAVKTDSKLSKTLYASLGEDVEKLKQRISLNLSRYVSQGRSWVDAAKALAKGMNTPYKKAINYALRIARTEGHRVQVESSLDAMHTAKKKGAEIVKQWDATLDGSTRDTHRKLDGQIRELDEPFEVQGHKAKGPGHFGRPEEDINCRCSILQRARWALDDDELETLKDRAAYYGLDKSKDFKDFSKKYLKAAEKVTEVAKAAKKAVAGALSVETWPASFKTKTAKGRVQKFVEFVNDLGKADSPTLELYSLLGQTRYFSTDGPSKVRFVKDDHYVQWTLKDGLKVQLPKMEGEHIRGQAQTFAHEMGHFIDAASAEGRYGMKTRQMPHDLPKISTDQVPQWVVDESERLRQWRRDASRELHEKANAEAKELGARYQAGEITWAEYDREYKKIKQSLDDFDAVVRDEYDGWNAVEDIIDALTDGLARDRGIVTYGHGSRYYRREEAKITEIWANYCSLQLTRPDLVEKLREEWPEMVEMLDGMRDKMLALARM